MIAMQHNSLCSSMWWAKNFAKMKSTYVFFPKIINNSVGKKIAWEKHGGHTKMRCWENRISPCHRILIRKMEEPVWCWDATANYIFRLARNSVDAWADAQNKCRKFYLIGKQTFRPHTTSPRTAKKLAKCANVRRSVTRWHESDFMNY